MGGLDLTCGELVGDDLAVRGGLGLVGELLALGLALQIYPREGKGEAAGGRSVFDPIELQCDVSIANRFWVCCGSHTEAN